MNPLDGAHHVTGITADITANVDFWCRILGLRLVKRTLNFETTFRYHLYYGDEEGKPGSVVTFLEFDDRPKGRPGRGNIQRVILRVASIEALDFWMDRLTGEQIYSEMFRMDPSKPAALVFEDFEGHIVELMVCDVDDAPLQAAADDIPEQFLIRGIEGVRSYSTLEESQAFFEHLGFTVDGERLVLRGATRSTGWYFSTPPEQVGEDRVIGVWDHLAFDAGEELQTWRDFANDGPLPFTPIYDHYYFDSSYARPPAGIVEICTYGPGFVLDQAVEDLGEELTLSPRTEPLRPRLEQDLTPVVNPRSRRSTEGKAADGAPKGSKSGSSNGAGTRSKAVAP
jgi:glyoxalase family protein